MVGTNGNTRRSAIPDSPGFLGLYMKHFKAILDCAAVHFSFLKKHGPRGIVNQIVDVMMGLETLVGNGRESFCIWHHAQWGRINDQIK